MVNEKLQKWIWKLISVYKLLQSELNSSHHFIIICRWYEGCLHWQCLSTPALHRDVWLLYQLAKIFKSRNLQISLACFSCDGSSLPAVWLLLQSHLSCLIFGEISAENVNFCHIVFYLAELYLFYSIKANVSIPQLSPRKVTQGCNVSSCGETHGWLLITLETYLCSQYGADSTGMSSILQWVTVRG